MRVAEWDKQLEDKLMEFLEGWMTQVVMYLGCDKDLSVNPMWF